MGFRFRKSISIIPGVRLNLSNGGASMSVGPRGASVSFTKRGTYANFGLPGTGLSYRTRLNRASAASRQRTAASQANPRLRELLEGEVQELNDAMDAIVNVHLLTPDPRNGHTLAELESHYRALVLKPYSVPAPVRPEKPQSLPEPEKPDEKHGSGFIGRLLESAAAKEERLALNESRWQQAVIDWQYENELAQKRYLQSRQRWAEQYAQWQYDAGEHERTMQESEANLSQRFAKDTAWFESLLAEVLQSTDWPRETLFSYQVKPGSSEILIDVDLPEVEDMPVSSVRVNAKGTEILEKELSQKAVRERYARHIHGCLLRITGIAFCALPFEAVTLSGFTQRISKQTGHLDDEYILSARINRRDFMRLNFSSLEDVDPVEAFGLFDLQRKMTATCIFQAITPFS